MKMAVIGAGAIGGFVGAKLALAGEDVTFIVRGANLDGDPQQRHQADHGRRQRARRAQRAARPTTTTKPARRTS